MNQRSAHNRELHSAGGSPTNESVWGQFQNRPLKGIKGKYIFNQLKNKIPGNSFSENNILNHNFSIEIALDLKNTLKWILDNS